MSGSSRSGTKSIETCSVQKELEVVDIGKGEYKQQTSSSKSMQGTEQSLQCLICLSVGMESPATVIPCHHQFCFQCVKQWTLVQRFPQCPVCQDIIQNIVKQDGEVQMVGVNENIEYGSGDLNLDSLDHGYFEKEIKRLLQFAQSVSSRLMQGFNYSSRNKHTQLDAEELQVALATNNQIISFLEQYRSQMQMLVNFEAMQVLSHLYKLQEQSQRILSATLGSKTESRKEILQDARAMVDNMLLEANLEPISITDNTPKIYGASDIDDVVFDADEFEIDNGEYDYDDNKDFLNEYTGKGYGPNFQPKKKNMWPDDSSPQNRKKKHMWPTD
eukprot:TRINITY_DN2659_c0_g3_i1.p2 TRINITY_DN2659_c0_g3~~TRINITY_DN2659_c0_g3_i1.p2  ORF type:complete len:345 (-),score=31.69 TRINITY_DN2659_c0_g3_i1:3067-4056(-)